MTETVNYDELAQQAEGLLSGQKHRIANAANLSALIYEALPDVNWAGFYFLEGDELIVGPFQGRPACVRIEMGKGVCGTAALTRATQRVADVHAFDGHIACDPESRSEVVVPLIIDGQVIGVLDIDSPRPGRFDEADQRGLERLSETYIRSLG
ncbi:MULTISPECIES: GAF domain-containing protein [unclassified Wenzhouxiangella]|uniref:GAF domain-containing protein n=1 Tax=unclassified Wenzhouxiangella TaxID=2613841 RepID=UPI000E32772B|nr:MULTISPECIES: GAF domain-containing protein [unclassified Wenzhouxiangella]RFF28533.1 GAF domain-containing protein [Wenzhouxiangella sp. 15181]RFP70051.1 GAF domain-containing protein [Wenzhouxiangella sp. 15190]